MSGPDDLRRFLSDCVDRGRMPGAGWRVEGPDGVCAEGVVGRAALEPSEVDLHEETPFDLASLTKPLCTALLLLLLEQERVLDPQAPSREWVEELGRSTAGEATLMELALHRSGLPAWSPLYLGGATAERMMQRLADIPPAAARGTTLYSDLGYIVLGLVIQRATRKPLDRLFRERVADPLGRARLAFSSLADPHADAAATERGNDYEQRLAGKAGDGHAFRREIPRGQVHDANAHGLGGVAGHAGLFGTAADVAAVAREMLRPEKLPLGSRARGLLLNPQPPAFDRTVGFVPARAAGAARGILPGDAPGHTGFTGTSIWLDPSAGRSGVLLTNRVHPGVPHGEFRWVRRGFHRLAATL